MKEKHRKIKDKETVGYTLKMPVELYGNIRELSYQKNVSIAYIMQEALEQYVTQEQEEDVRRKKKTKTINTYLM